MPPQQQLPNQNQIGLRNTGLGMVFSITMFLTSTGLCAFGNYEPSILFAVYALLGLFYSAFVFTTMALAEISRALSIWADFIDSLKEPEPKTPSSVAAKAISTDKPTFVFYSNSSDTVH
jgi:hypothetical protein